MVDTFVALLKAHKEATLKQNEARAAYDYASTCVNKREYELRVAYQKLKESL